MSMNEAGEEKPLLLLQGTLGNRIKQKKREMHDSHNNNDNIMYIEKPVDSIPTIQWVLGQILTILKSRRK